MKKMIVYFLCVVCIFMASCSHDPADSGTRVHEWVDSTINGNATMSEMKFSIGRNMVVESHAQTRTTTEIDGSVTFSTGDLIAIAVTQAGNPEEVKLYRVTSDGSLEYAGSGESFKWERNTVSIRAWSYGTSTEIANTLTPPEDYDYSLTANQQTSDYLELLYCKAASHTYASSPVTLTFYHQLSRLVINVSHDLSTTLSITSVSVGSSTFPTTARFSVPTGSSNVGSWTPSAYGTIVPKTETTQGSYQATYSAVVFPDTYTKDSKIFTLTNSDGSYIYSITESAGQTFTAGNQYTLAINVRDDITKNPLWWVAQYNLASNKTSFVTEHSTTDQYVFSFNDAKGANISGFHLPTRDDFVSIIPSDKDDTYGTNLWGISGTKANPTEFSEIACNVGGKSVAASTSVLGKDGSELYAVRFIGTTYASAWHYKWVESPCDGLLIESYLVQAPNLTIAKTVLAGLSSSGGIFTGVYNAAGTNLSPANTTMTTNAFVQRFFPACGYRNGTGSGIADEPDGYAHAWTSTTYSNNTHGWYLRVSETSMNMYRFNKTNGYPVRLFKGYAPALGDKFYSDGTWGNNPHAADATVVGIVAWLGDDNDLKCGKMHGLVMALNSTPTAVAWGPTSTDESFLTNVSSISGCNTYDKNGLTNTNNLIADAHTHNAATAARNTTPAAPSTAGNTNWFLPSAAQWIAVMGSSGIGKYSGTFVLGSGWANSSTSVLTNINSYLTANGVGGSALGQSDYWTSSENDDTHAVYVYFHKTSGFHFNISETKKETNSVRAFLAF